MSQMLTDRAIESVAKNIDAHRRDFDAWCEGRTGAGANLDDLFEDQMERHREQVIAAVARYVRTIPELYADALLDRLDEDQHREELARWLDDQDARTLFLVGPAGTGKTYASYAVAAEHVALSAPKTSAVVWSVPALLDALRPSAGNTEATWERAKSARLLVLDDLAAAKPSDWATERMWMLADARTSANLRTIVTTNSPWAELISVWGEPTLDRLRDRSVVLKFAGTSRRQPAPAR